MNRWQADTAARILAEHDVPAIVRVERGPFGLEYSLGGQWGRRVDLIELGMELHLRGFTFHFDPEDERLFIVDATRELLDSGDDVIDAQPEVTLDFTAIFDRFGRSDWGSR
jgi:hypothetical protein